MPERGKDLARRVYREDPFLASRSEIINDIFPSATERKELLSKVLLPTGKALFTIGYEGDSIPSHRRRELNTQADYDALFEEYEAEDLPQQSEAINKLLTLLEQHERIALTCFEQESHCCHRHCISEAMRHTKPAPPPSTSEPCPKSESSSR